MSIVLFFLPQGQVIGKKESVSNDGKVFEISNPTLVVAREQNVSLVPFLLFTNEKAIKVNVDDVAFKQFFTPVQDLANHYNQIFGSGIIVADSSALAM